ncbi:RHS repeat-associated core domain-containing protein [Kosakonia sp. 1610]|uniref:RHS repeat-associated core domain-containing protein n=1 Tax=Kosakonia sp. 1610 TaxID=3156426 RepID=UPI003D1D50DA
MWRRHARKPARTQYAWSGLQMVGETSDSHPDAAVQYIHTENSYEPLARVDSHGEHADIFWYHTELNGLPDSVTDSNGDTVWRGASTAWGRSLRESTPVTWDTPQNLRFQGQYLDRETGLHYNTFRYYDPAGGCYTQMDPIGRAGGLNTYAYVPNALIYIDPLGLDYTTWQIHSPGYGDIVQKGLHFYAPGGIELSVRPDHKGGITFTNAIPNEAGSPKLAKAIASAKEHFEKDDRFRNDILNKANEGVQSVLEHAKKESGT